MGIWFNVGIPLMTVMADLALFKRTLSVQSGEDHMDFKVHHVGLITKSHF